MAVRTKCFYFEFARSSSAGPVPESRIRAPFLVFTQLHLSANRSFVVVSGSILRLTVVSRGCRSRPSMARFFLLSTALRCYRCYNRRLPLERKESRTICLALVISIVPSKYLRKLCLIFLFINLSFINLHNVY